MSHSLWTTLYIDGKKDPKSKPFNKGKHLVSLKMRKMLPSEPKEGFLEVIVTLRGDIIIL